MYCQTVQIQPSNMAPTAKASTLNRHPTAIIDPSANVDESAEVGPFCFIGPAVKIGARTRLLASVTVVASTHIGSDCEIHPNVVLGGRPQVHGFKTAGPNIDKPLVVIGNKCTIREFVSVHQSTAGPDAPTRIGNKVYIMTNAHVAHDCIVEDNVTIVTGVGLAGHCHIMKGATLGGMAGFHQHVRVGPGAFVGAGSMLVHDALPFSMVQGNRARTKGLNAVGLQRSGWTPERIEHVQRTMFEYFATGKIEPEDVNVDVQVMLDFARGSKQGIALPVGVASPSAKAKM